MVDIFVVNRFDHFPSCMEGLATHLTSIVLGTNRLVMQSIRRHTSYIPIQQVEIHADIARVVPSPASVGT